MIEKIMKAVKSGNKKRGRNITIGAVVGFLLSCTAVMGEDNYLWIKEESGTIKFSTDNDLSTSLDNPYSENNWDGSIYINNITLSGTDNDSGIDGYGLKLGGDLGGFELINSGSIAGTATGNERGYGIYNNSDSIRSLTNNGSIIGTSENYDDDGIVSGIHNGSGTITTLANNGSIIGIAMGRTGESYGIRNESGTITTLANNGLIIGVYRGSMGESEGIYNESGTIESLVNSGSLTGMSIGSSGYGIYNKSGTIESLANSGSIEGRTTTEVAIGIENLGTIIELTNNGSIKGTAVSDKGYGIQNTDTITKLVNNGSVKGTAAGNLSYGIDNRNVIGHISNLGVIYGSASAIKNGTSTTIGSLNNYGILATKGSSVVTNSGTISSEKYYGLEIDEASGIVSNGSDYASLMDLPTEIIVGYDKNGDPIKRDLAIKNAVIQGGSGSGTSTDSFVFLSNPTEFDNSILNGKDKTLKVIGTDREVKGSIINAYGTAVAFEGANGQLTLSGTTVNGGTDETNNITVSGSDNGDTLILQSGEVEYVGGGKGTQNTIINGNIDMKAGDDTLTLAKGTIINGNTSMGDNDDILTVEAGNIINGTLDGGMGSDTLSFNSPIARDAVNGGINIHHNISGFEKMNINTNVTLFEKIVKDDGTLEDLAITGAENITIGENGVLTLRINSADSNKHALSTGNTGTIKSENGGKFLLALNGAGRTTTISFGNLVLDESLITGSKGNFDTTSKLHTVEKLSDKEVVVTARWDLPNYLEYQQLNKIYQGIVSVEDLIGNFNVDNDEKLSTFLGYLNDIYAGNPYSYSSELSRKSAGMFRDIVTENIFKPEANKWMIYGGLTHVDGGTKDTYYGKGYYTYDIGSSDMDADTKITGAYMLGEYGVSDTLTSGVVIGGNKLKSDLSNGSKVEGSALYLGAYAKKYVGNLKVTAGAGFQYGDYDADRLAVNNVASSTGTPVIKYSDNYNDMTYDIYLNGRYSHNIGDNLFLEPYATLSYTYIDQDGADEGNQTLAIETDSKSFDYTVGKAGLDLKKVIPHEKGKSTLSAGVSYTKILDGADEEFITGRFKGGRDFDILVAHKNEHSIGVNAKYALELENGVLFDVKGTYTVERDSHNGAGKNKTKGEWVVGAGLGYKF